MAEQETDITTADNSTHDSDTHVESLPDELSIRAEVQEIAKSLFDSEDEDANENVNETSEENEEDSEETENTDLEDDDFELDESDVADSEDEDSDEFDIPELESIVTDYFDQTNAPDEVRKVWERQWRGIEKQQRKLEQTATQYQSLIDWGASLDNKDTALEAFRSLAEQIKTFHGVTDLELYGTDNSATSDNTDSTDGIEEWQKLGFQYESDYIVWKKAQEELTKLRQEIAPLKSEYEQLKALREQQESQAKFDKFIKATAPKVIAYFAKADNGFKVTKEMVAEAVKAYPTLAQNPVKAVKAHYSDERAAHYKALAAKPTPKAPDMVPVANARGRSVKSADDYNAHDAYADLGI